MKILERYIMARTFRMVLAVLLPVMAILWLTQVLGRINLVTDNGQSAMSFLTLATLILPTVVPTVLPFAIVLAAAQTLTAMNNDSELAVMDAGGARRSIIYRPILLLAAAMCVFSFSLINYIEPASRGEIRKVIATVYADLLSSVIEEKTFREVDDGLYVQISERLSGRVLRGLFVADYRDPANPYIYYAQEGAVDSTGGQLIMKDGQVQRQDAAGNVSIIQFDSYSFDLSELTKDRSQTGRRPSDRDLNFLLNPGNDPDYLRRPEVYRAELARRLTDWTLPFIYALFTIVIVGDARSHREKRVPPMASAFGLTLVLRLISHFAANEAENTPALIYLIYGLPVICLVIGVVLLLRPHKLRTRPSWTQRLRERSGRGDKATGAAS
ncbi:LptF/LptG family permease [Martelella sp. HB161492]|uniref:LptF/LptG family permease n=1 Tax=Martelella sp. HB161492 TaxID=2720726 RepID=UPI001592A57D|nr:LptF/LptG family permease [Martelella sp. HB161492]